MSRLHWLFWINEISKYQNDLIPQDERAQAFTETWSSQNFAIGSPISVQNEDVENLQNSISKELVKLKDPSPRKLTADSQVFQVTLMNKANQTNGNAKVPKSAQQHIPLKLIQVSDRVYGYIFSAGYIRDSAPTILFGHFEEARKLLTASRIQRLRSQNMFNVYSITHSSSLLFLRDELERKQSKTGNQIRK
jgi:hypothetical protein